MRDGCIKVRPDLLHDASLALGEGDVTARLVLNEFDIYLSSLATGFVIVVVIVIGSGAAAGTFDATSFAISIAGRVGEVGRVVIGVGDVAHLVGRRQWLILVDVDTATRYGWNRLGASNPLYLFSLQKSKFVGYKGTSTKEEGEGNRDCRIKGRTAPHFEIRHFFWGFAK